MASTCTDDKASVALLRRVRAGERVHFVHHVDVCDAVPELLVADLEPVPGTGVEDGGYSRVWYFYHAKKYKNTRGDTSGHRQRAVAGGGDGGTGWHSERRAKDVEGSGGGTSCNFSYGRKMGRSAKSIDRMGWCMVEYDFAAKQPEEEAAASNYVLCKVYRSRRAKGKLASASSSKNATAQQTTKKRTAGGGEHPEAPAAKLIRQQEPQVHQETAYCCQPHDVQEIGVQQAAGPGRESEHCHGAVNDFNIEDFNVDEYRDILEMMLQEEPKPDREPPEEQHDGRFIELPCGPVLATEVTAGDTTTYGHCSSYAPSWLYTSATTGCSSGLLQVERHDHLQAPAFLSHVLTRAQGFGY